jgi:hypothetical protein
MAACAQGVSSPGTEGLTDGSGSVSSAGASSAGSGNVGNPGGPPELAGGAPGSGYSGSSSSTSDADAGGSTGTAGGSTGSAGSSTGAAGAASGSAGAANTTGACGHFQPGNMGPTLQSMAEGTGMDAIYFDVEIDNPDDRDISVGDLKFRYYLDASDLGTLSTDIYLKDIKAVSGTTRSVDITPAVTYADTYFEVSFAGSTSLIHAGESLKVKVHTHNADYKTHDQTMDYSYNPSQTMTPWCHVVLYELAPATWGNPPSP